MKQILTLILALLCKLSSSQTTLTRSGTLFSSSGTGTGWSDPFNVQASDNARANASNGALIGSGSENSEVLSVKGFGFSVPVHATVLAVRVRIERRRTSGNIYDNSLYLLKGGMPAGTNKAATAVNWPSADAYALYGNTTSDLWGTTLTPFDINSPNFGVSFSATLSNPSLVLGSASADIDHIEVSITYTVNGALDKDKDGIPDLLDFDADNDGIPNNRELTACGSSNNFTWSGQTDGTDPSSVDVTSGGLSVNSAVATAASLTDFDIDNTYAGTAEKEVHVLQSGASNSNKTILTFILSKPVANPRFYIQDIDMSAGQFIDNVQVTAYYQGQAYNFSASEVTTSGANNFIGNNTIQGTGITGDNSTDGQVLFQLNTIADKLVITYWNSDPAAGSQGMGIGGISFCELSTMDRDGDNIANYLDRDSDGDGLADIAESGGVDTDGDGKVDGTFADTDGDGLANAYDPTSGGNAIALWDTDRDGIPNYIDLDSDNDGMPDVLEVSGTDSDNDGRSDGTTDSDADGMADSVDGDANDDGTAENSSGAPLRTSADSNADGMADGYPYRNTDSNGLPDVYDLDSDIDGILDIIETGLSQGTDTNGDGWNDAIDALPSISARNSDADGLPDYRDIDSDNDGITDNVEGLTTAAYIILMNADSDMDGLDNVYDTDDVNFNGSPANGIIPTDTDADGTPDYRDTDSDNDGRTDVVEGHDYNLNGLTDDNVTLSGVDSDGDGLDNTFDLGNGHLVLQNGMLNGGAFGDHVTPGAVGPLQRSFFSQSDRDWRYAAAPLPLHLTSFTASAADPGAYLQWLVQDASDVREFEVHRSDDGIRFIKIGTVRFESVPAQHAYNFADRQPVSAKAYYRLKIIDTDGSSAYSKTVHLSNRSDYGLLSFRPNPAKESVTISLNALHPDENYVLYVAGASGQTIYRTTLTGNKRSITLDLSLFKSGLYFIQLRDRQQKQVAQGQLVVE